MDIIKLLEDNKWTLAALVTIIIVIIFPNYKWAVMVGWLIIFFVFIGVKYGSGDANLLTSFYNMINP